MKSRSESFRLSEYIVFSVLTIAFFLLCVCLGSVSIPLNEVFSALLGRGQISESARSIILSSRIPRVLTAALSGASLSLCGGAMQGLLRNPLADPGLIGVSSGASLGAISAIVSTTAAAPAHADAAHLVLALGKLHGRRDVRL
mgnify:CR=1 FL=1